MSTDLDLGALKELCEKVTPGPWEAERREPFMDGRSHYASRRRDVPGVFATMSTLGPDADFIAASRSAVPALIAEVERLRADRDRARSVAAALEQELAVKDEAIEQIKHEIDDWPDDAVENVTNILARLAARIEAANRDYDEKER